MRHIHFLPLLVVVLAISIGACHRSPEQDAPLNPPTALTAQKSWRLSGLTVEGEEQKVLTSSTIAFTETAVRGEIELARFQGTYKARENGELNLNLQQDGIPEIAIDPAIGKQMEDSLKVLDRVNHFESQEGRLLLSDGSKDNVLQFEPDTPEPSLPLKGTVWTLTIIEESDGTTPDATVSARPAPAENAIFLQFEQDRVSGSGGCNRISGKVERPKDGHIRFLELTTTEEGGSAEAMAAETDFVGKLSKMSRYTISSNRLVLANESSTVALHFDGSPPNAPGQNASR